MKRFIIFVVSLLSGCDAELWIPNSEMTPAGIAQMGRHHYKLLLEEPGGEGKLLSSDQIRSQFPLIMANSTRIESPVGISDGINVLVKSSKSEDQFARIVFSISKPVISNDGREYNVAVDKDIYVEFISELWKEKRR